VRRIDDTDVGYLEFRTENTGAETPPPSFGNIVDAVNSIRTLPWKVTVALFYYEKNRCNPDGYVRGSIYIAHIGDSKGNPQYLKNISKG